MVRRTRQPIMFFRDVTDTNQSESHSGLGGPEEDHQLHHCCWTGRVSEREEEEEEETKRITVYIYIPEDNIINKNK